MDKNKDNIEIIDAYENNLKHISLTIPKNKLVVFAGVSGSGKSSIACNEFVNKYPYAIVIDQKPIGTSIRSTPATYTGVMDEIRKLFAKEKNVDSSKHTFRRRNSKSKTRFRIA